MKMLHFIHFSIAQYYYKWAMKEINPLNPDVPRIIIRQSQLRDKEASFWAS